MQKEIVLKKNIFGGFNRKQVIDCLSQLKSDCFADSNPEELRFKQAQIERMQSDLKEKDDKIKELQAQLNDLNKSKSYTDSGTLFEANRIVTNAKNNAEEINTILRNDVVSKKIHVEEMFDKIKNINKEIDRIKNSLLTSDYKLSDISIKKVTCVEPKEKTKPKSVEFPETEIIEQTPDEIDIADKYTVDENETESNAKHIKDTDENNNSIDNFFDELYKMTNSKLFEQSKKSSDTSDDFEYEY